MFKSAVFITIAFFVVRMLGLIKQVVLANIYGASYISDAFVIAFTMPDIILACVGSSLATIYIPMYQNVADKNKFTSNILNITLVVGIVLTALFTAIPDVLVNLFTTGLNEKTFDVAVVFTRLMMFTAVPILLIYILKAYLQVKEIFFASTIMEAWINIFTIVGIILGAHYENLNLIPATAMLGHFTCLLALLIMCCKRRFSYIACLELRCNEIKQMFYLFIPVFLGTVVAELNMIVDRNFASYLAEGTISSINYANRINGIIYTLFTTAAITVMYPQLAKVAAVYDLDKIKYYLRNGISIVLYVILPLSIIMCIFAEPIVKIMFESGDFNSRDRIVTAQCLQMYTLSYLAININPLLNRIFYVFSDTKTTMKVSILAVAINIILNFIFIDRFKHIGIAGATSVTAVFTTLILAWLLRKKIGAFGINGIGKDIVKIIIINIIGGAILYYAGSFVDIELYDKLDAIALMTAVFICFTAYYAAASYWSKVELFFWIKNMVTRKVIKK